MLKIVIIMITRMMNNPEYIKYVRIVNFRRNRSITARFSGVLNDDSVKDSWLNEFIAPLKRVSWDPDPNECLGFAEECIKHLDSLAVADNAGFYDDSGKAWTLSKRVFREECVEIYVKCRDDKNFIKTAWIYPAKQILYGDYKGFPVSVGEWLVQVVEV